MSNVILIALEILIFVYSIIIHEISHGYAALKRGDRTALAYGRLTLNPVPHIDPIGSILLPLTLFILTRGQVVFGWAKPVPVNPYNFNNPRKDEAFVSLAGPLSNLILATIFGLVLRFWPMISIAPLLVLIVRLNLSLAIFNLLPIYPLDGSHILFYFFPKTESFLTRYGYFILIVLMFGGINFLSPVINLLFKIVTGF